MNEPNDDQPDESLQDDEESANEIGNTRNRRNQEQREERLRILSQSLSEKKFVDITELQLNIPTKPQNGFSPHNWKNIEQQITNFFDEKNLIKVPPNDLDGYCGIIVGKYPELYDTNYHGWKHLKSSIQNKLKYIRDVKKRKSSSTSSDISNRENDSDSRTDGNNEQQIIQHLNRQIEELQSQLNRQLSRTTVTSQQTLSQSIENQQNSTNLTSSTENGMNLAQTFTPTQPTQNLPQHTPEQSIENQNHQNLEANSLTELQQAVPNGGNVSVSQTMNQSQVGTNSTVQIISTNAALNQIATENMMNDVTNLQTTISADPPQQRKKRGRPRKNVDK